MTRRNNVEYDEDGRRKRGSKQVISMMNQDLSAPPDPVQGELVEVDEEELIAAMAGEIPSDKFKFKAMLIVQPIDGVGLPNSIPICCGECPGDRIEEILHRGIRARSFKTRLRSVVGEPSKVSELNALSSAKII